MSERKTLEEFQELECRSRNMRPFQYLPVNKRRDITIIAWQSFHDEEMKAKDAEIQSLKQYLSERDKELKYFQTEYADQSVYCDCHHPEFDGDVDLLNRPSCSNCGNLQPTSN